MKGLNLKFLSLNRPNSSSSASQDDFQLHWPLVNSDHMATRLAKRELEKKRIEDAHR